MKKPIGTLAWFDLTVDNAVQVRDFYTEIVGWKPESVDMGEYQDYSMLQPDNEECVSGICHKRGANANMPAQWLMYFYVADLDASLDKAKQQGGQQLTEIRFFGDSRYAVIQDPAGAVCALYQE